MANYLFEELKSSGIIAEERTMNCWLYAARPRLRYQFDE